MRRSRRFVHSFLSVITAAAVAVTAVMPALNTSAARAASADSTAEERILDTEYEIYPKPQSVQYGDGNMRITEQASLLAGDKIDGYTTKRLEETLDEFGITVTQAESPADGVTNFVLDVYSQENAQKYGLDEALFEKSDAYVLDIQKDAVTVIGADSDAVFYGVTTLRRILRQTSNREVRKLRVEDFSDIKNRGFIEGYYGNPWSVEDRIELMKFGGELKLNQYIFAPKDDPYHNSSWRELYPENELAEIRRMAEAGNENKCYFIWTIHCFMNSPFRFDTEENYKADFKTITAKFTQLLEAGVRQIGVLGDDAGSIPPSNALRLLEDLDGWLEEQQGKYPNIRREILYCPADYYGDGTSGELRTLNTGNSNIQILATGGKIWGQITPTFGTQWSANIATEGYPGRRPYMWVNWPCTDNSKNHLIMGGQDQFLQAGTDGSQYAGMVLNPMQQSEPSKVAIFANADFAWNCWETKEEGEQNWYDSFKYVENMSPEDSEESAALRELSKHMINQAMDSRVVALEESVELAPKLEAFREKMNGGGLTPEEIDEMKAEFVKLNNAAERYLKSGKDRMVRQITPFVSSMRDVSSANLSFLDALKAELSGEPEQLWECFSEGQAAFEQSQQYGFDYRGEVMYAEVGNQHILPFTEELLKTTSDKLNAYLNPENQKLEETVIVAVNGNASTRGYDLQKVTDGNLSTYIEITRQQQAGDYVGMIFNFPVHVKEVQIDLWKEDSPKNLFYEGVMEYTADGKNWIEFDQSMQPVGRELKTITVSNIDMELRGFRYRCTDTNNLDRWLTIREIQYNMSNKTQERVEYYKGTLIRTEGWRVYQGDEGNVTDGNDGTFVWYDPGNENTSRAGDYIGLDLGEVKKIGVIHIVLGGDRNDKWESYEVQLSVDNEEWVSIGSYTGTYAVTDSIDLELDGPEARYVRLVNKADINKWLQFSEFSVGSPILKNINYTNVTESGLTAWYGTDTFRINPSSEISLKPGEYVGLDLGRIREIKQANLSVSSSAVTLEASDNGVEWGEPGNCQTARYVRLANHSAKETVFSVTKFEITTNEVHEPALGEATIGMQNAYAGEDARTTGTAGNWFDGDVTTEAKFCDFPRKGQYVLYDLGRDMDITAVRVIVASTEIDYPRDAAIEVSADKENWERILTIGDGEPNDAGDRDTIPQDNGWTFDTNLPNYVYQEARDFDTVKARYLRVYITADYTARFLKLAEIELNGGAYVPAENMPAYAADPIELRGRQPQNMTDGDFSTSFKPDMTGRTEGSVVYRLSEKLNVTKINIAQSANAVSNAKVTARVGNAGQASEWIELGVLDKSLTTLWNPGYDYLYELKLEWGDVSPVIYEIITRNQVTKEWLEETVQKIQEQIREESLYTTSTIEPLRDALKHADAVIKDQEASWGDVTKAVRSLQEAFESLKRRADLSALEFELSKAEGLKKENYTKETWDAYSRIQSLAVSLIEKADDCTQGEADKILGELKKAREALLPVSTLKPEDPKPTPPQPDKIKVSGLKITVDTKNLAAGKKVTVKTTVSPANATEKRVVYSSSNKKYATVNAKGVVTAKKAGAGKTVTITAAAADGSGKKASVKIRIYKKAVKKIKLFAKTKTVKAGKKVKVRASVTPAKNIYKKLKWKSGNTKYAVVSSNGMVRTKKAGKGKKVRITAQALDGSRTIGKITIKIK